MTRKFSDIVDISIIQAFLESQWETSGIMLAVMDPNENLLADAGGQDICSQFHRVHPETIMLCEESDGSFKAHLEQLRAEGGYHEYKCKNGLMNIAVPIFIKEEHLATLFAGPFLYEAPDRDFFKGQARRYGLDEKAYLAALEKVPIFSPRQIKTILGIQVRFVNRLTRIGLDKQKKLEAESEHRNSEDKFRTLFENSNDAVYILKPTGRLLEVNRAVCEQLGYGREELLQKNMSDLLAPDRAVNFENRVREIQQEGRLIFETVHLCKDGSSFPAEVSVRPFHFLGADALLGTFRDISERKRGEEALREADRKLNTLMDNLPGMAYRCCNDRKWTMEFVSEGCLELTGYLSDDLLGNKKLSYNDIIHPDDQEKLWQHIQSSVKEERPFEFEYRICTADGKEVWVWEQGRGIFAPDGGLLALEGFITDITGRKEVERELAFREAFEGLIATISSRFVALSAAETDSGVDAALRELGEFAEADRSYVFLFAADLSEMTNSHEWCAPGIEPQAKKLQRLPIDETPWFFDKLSRQEVVYVPQVKDLPAEAAAEKAHWEKQDIRSLISVPIISSDRLTGFLGFDAVASEKEWSKQDLALLKTVGEIFGSALARQKTEKEREQLLHDMGERIKELRGLYRMSQLLRQDIPLEALFQEATTIIPPSWHYPEITRVKLRFDDREHVSSPFEETPWKQSADIVVVGQCRGTLDVYYLEPRPMLEEGPFLQEERNLLDSLALILGETIERKLAERALRESEERFHSIFDATTTPMGILSPTGDIQQVNPAACRFFGYTNEEMSKLNVLDVTHPDDRPTTSALYDEVFAGQRADSGYEKRYLRKDGTVRWGHTTIAPVVNESGQVVYCVVLTQDITGRKQAEEELKKHHDHLEKLVAERTAELDKANQLLQQDIMRREEIEDKLRRANRELEAFAYTVSHDLRDPLGAIIGSVNYLLEDQRSQFDEDALDFLMGINSEGERMMALIEDLLTLSRVGEVERPHQPVDVAEVVRQSVATLREMISTAGTDVRVGPLPTLHVPRTLIAQIFDNLIGNAVRYAGRDGGSIDVGGERRGDKVRLFVRDHGQGVPEEERERVFEVFYRGSLGKKVVGTGVGLATVLKIARTYGGGGWVEETPGGGSTFWVEMVDIETATRKEQGSLEGD